MMSTLAELTAPLPPARGVSPPCPDAFEPVRRIRECASRFGYRASKAVAATVSVIGGDDIHPNIRIGNRPLIDLVMIEKDRVRAVCLIRRQDTRDVDKVIRRHRPYL